jgi:hypothetical protein
MGLVGLADEIRLQIDRCELPAARPPKWWAAYGNGKPCSACGEPIHPAEISGSSTMRPCSTRASASTSDASGYGTRNCGDAVIERIARTSRGLP